MRAGEWGGFVLDLLFPRRCPWCGVVVGFGRCGECEAEARRLALPGHPLDAERMGHETPHLDECLACYRYEGAVRQGIRRFKYTQDEAAARPLGALLAEAFRGAGLAERYDIIVCVPQTRAERREKGFNQAERLARQLARHSGLPFCKALVKERETRRQAGLGRADRRKNVKGAFAVKNREEITGKAVLLVDDIITTGSTLDACAEALLAAGAMRCGSLCLAATFLRAEANSDG